MLAKKKLLLFSVLPLLIACSSPAPVEDVKAEVSMEQSMATMPCHQMANGMWMGDCDK